MYNLLSLRVDCRTLPGWGRNPGLMVASSGCACHREKLLYGET